ncbi:hypothetical protein PLESTB_000461000 [Pleodorina starrii]|uniref:Uncharacterized protein n=1 Tax=Pleodorina starrii TaxID=330485 RepID=A0A9W6BFC8_9CHLO|nr:hypothetical protein PLESTM_000795400 [Pleodorina starrii]GLC51054.1 hypothetical protein PLESTB_000461000 [Pleodorina starrii]
MACAGLLADLAEEYEKSRALLEQLEDSLKDRACLPEFDAPNEARPDALSDLQEGYEGEDGEDAGSEEDEEQRQQEPSGKELSRAAPGFRAKLAHFFGRNRSESMHGLKVSASVELDEPKARISVVNLNGTFGAGAGAGSPQEDHLRRSVSFRPAGSHSSNNNNSNAALQPTAALARGMPRASLEIRQQQLILDDTATSAPPEPRRLSSCNLRRKSLDPFSPGGLAGPGRRLSTLHQVSLDNAAATSIAARGSCGQLQLLSGSPTGPSSPIHGFSPRQPLPPPPPLVVTDPSGAPAAPQVQMQALLPGSREDSHHHHHHHHPLRHRSLSRRGSDNAAGLTRAGSFTPPQQQQQQYPPQQLGSPVGCTSPSGARCLSPSASLFAGGALPALNHAQTASTVATARSLLMRNSSNNTSYESLRAHSASTMAAATAVSSAPAGSADEYHSATANPLASSAGGERCAVSATGMIYGSAAASLAAASAAAGTASGGSSPVLSFATIQLPALPHRARSMHMTPSSSLGPGGLVGSDVRRLQSFRLSSRGSASGLAPTGAETAEVGSSGRRQSLGQYGTAVSGGGGSGAGKEGVFRGTLHLI